MSTKPVVYIGAERVGKAVLKSLLKMEKNIVAVFTAKDTLRDKIADYTDFSDLEKQYRQVDFHYIEDSAKKSVIKKIKSYKPKAIFVISWSKIIPSEILNIPPKGVIGLHYSLLPERRGGAPLNWAIIDGLKKIGITLFYMDEGIDTGDIIAQKKISIGVEETVNDLLKKIIRVAPPFILKNFDMIAEGNPHRIKQDESSSSYTPRRMPKDSEIDWSWDLKKIHNFIRALAPPYPSAFFKSQGKKIEFISAKMVENKKLKIEGYIKEENI